MRNPRYLSLLCASTLFAGLGFSAEKVYLTDCDGCSRQGLRSPCLPCCADVVATLFSHSCGCRLAPQGDMTPHYPYETWRMYYHNRPYNADHVRHAVNGFGLSQPSTSPYTTRLLDDVARTVELEVLNGDSNASSVPEPENEAASLVRDRFLEFVDWTRHRDARLKWKNESNSTGTLPIPNPPEPKSSATEDRGVSTR